MDVRYDVKRFDFYHCGKHAAYKHRQDVADAIRVFYDFLGGAKHYAKLSSEIRHICASLRHSLISNRFPTMRALRQHLETLEWTTML